MKCKFCVSLLFMASFLISCAQTSTSLSRVLNAAAYKEAINAKNIQVLDVRTAAEFNGGHIQNSLQANWLDSKEFKNRTQHLDKSKVIYIYCQSGGRSASAQEALMQAGYQVVNLEGGMSNWKMQQMPVEGSGNTVQMRVADFQKLIQNYPDNKFL